MAFAHDEGELGVEDRQNDEGGGEAHSGGEARRQERAAVFVEWLLRTFGHVIGDGTCEGAESVVLDVAGGRGEVCFHLSLAGVRCTLVDPRPYALRPDTRFIGTTRT